MNIEADHIDEIDVPWTKIIREDFHVVVYEDGFPVSVGHLLFVPKYNTAGIIAEAFGDAHAYGRKKVADGEWDAYNIGMNCGAEAGQTIMWPHIHLIPRFKGDVADPIGGVRAVIPSQSNYKSTEYKNPNE